MTTTDNRKLIEDVAREAYARPGRPVVKLARAAKYMALMHADSASFETIADGFALFAAMNGKRVTIDDAQLIPLFTPEGDVQ